MGRPKKNTEENQQNVEQPENQNVASVKVIERDEFGLVKGQEYKFDENGFIDWKAMIPKKFLFLNNSVDRIPEIEKRYGKTFKEIDIEKDNVQDRDLVIMLGGIKYLLKLRGYVALSYHVASANADYSAVTCKITFIPNYETEGMERVFEDSACAHYNNTNSWYSKYLIEAATNRSFCRCVRNFLGINIVSKDELGQGNAVSDDDSPESDDRQNKIDVLQKEMDKRSMTWLQLKQKLEKAQQERGSYLSLNLDETSGIHELPNDIIFDITTKLKRANKK